jgi:hypothetical protein
VGKNAQLNLAVVGADQHVAFVSNERAADLLAGVGAHRDVLQVGVFARQPAGGHCLAIRGVDAIFGIRHFRQHVHVGGFQLAQVPPLEDLRRQLVQRRQCLQRADVGAAAGALGGLALLGQFQLIVQHRA